MRIDKNETHITYNIKSHGSNQNCNGTQIKL